MKKYIFAFLSILSFSACGGLPIEEGAPASKEQISANLIACKQDPWSTLKVCQSSTAASSPLSPPTAPVLAEPVYSPPAGPAAPQLCMQWEAKSGASGYKLYRCMGQGCASNQSAMVLVAAPGAETLYACDDVVQGNYYMYMLKACNGAGCSPFSGAVGKLADSSTDVNDPPGMQQFGLLSPSYGAVLAGSSVTFAWNRTFYNFPGFSEIEPTRYIVKLKTSLGGPVVQQFTLSVPPGSVIHWPLISGSVSPGTYYWFVTAEWASFGTLDSLYTWRFTKN